jgi:NADH dehydrogenase FAD-containing subunit
MYRPVRCVIVGGGYAGSRLAYSLDSVFDVTLIDEKNFFEQRTQLMPVLCAPWNEARAAMAAASHHLHRFYLRRSNVVTGTAVRVAIDEESEADAVAAAADAADAGQRAWGRFFSSWAARANARTDRVVKPRVGPKYVELADGRRVPFDMLILATGERLAFPFRTQQRTSDMRLKEVEAFCNMLDVCNRVAVVGGGPLGCAVAAELAAHRPTLEVDLYHKHNALLPRLPSAVRQSGADILANYRNLSVHLNSSVEGVRSVDLGGKSSNNGGSATVYDLAVRNTPNATDVKPPSVFMRMFHRTLFRGHGADPVPDAGAAAAAASHEGETVEEKRGYDYVFMCGGAVPDNRLVAASPALRDHLTYAGRVQVSKYMQLLGYPEVFAVGRCNSFPWVRSANNSDAQARALFRSLLTIVSDARTTKNQNNAATQANAITVYRMAFPRISLRVGPSAAVASSAWSGGITGAPAVAEVKQDASALYRDFVHPTFSKPHELSVVRPAFDAWLTSAVTDVADF